MPKYGLTDAMRKTAPWGMSENVLKPGKVITDPVHGDLHLMRLEMGLVDSPPFQRLRKVRQLGSTHLVYPGATHTRLSHSLGAVKVAQDLMDTVIDQRSGRSPKEDLFMQWEAELGIREADGNLAFHSPADAKRFDRRIAEVTILARLGALLHDFCHVPYGHSIEDDLGILTAHDQGQERFDRLWGQIPEKVRKPLEEGEGDGGEGLKAELVRLILSDSHDGPETAYPFVADVVGNTICADLLDYLRRDHLFTGLPLALGRRFEAGYYVLPDGDPLYQRKMVLRVHRDEQERPDAITEILKHLRYRYELSERALVHHAKLAADTMIGKTLEIWRDALWAELAADQLTDNSDASWAPGRTLEALHAALAANQASGTELDAQVRAELDEAMTRRSDDGLFEYLRELPTAPREGVRHRDDSRRATVATLAKMVEQRHLFKRIAVQRHTREDREKFYREHGGPDNRRRMEQRAARFAGLDPAWQVQVWLPSPKMRLKVAGVLVDDGKEIRKFVDREEDDKDRGADIYRAHKDLWAVSVYVAPKYKDDLEVTRMLLASLGADLDIELGDLKDHLDGAPPHEWPERLAIKWLEREAGRTFPEPEKKEALRTRREEVMARGGEGDRPAIAALAQEYKALLVD